MAGPIVAPAAALEIRLSFCLRVKDAEVRLAKPRAERCTEVPDLRVVRIRSRNGRPRCTLLDLDLRHDRGLMPQPPAGPDSAARADCADQVSLVHVPEALREGAGTGPVAGRLLLLLDEEGEHEVALHLVLTGLDLGPGRGEQGRDQGDRASGSATDLGVRLWVRGGQCVAPLTLVLKKRRLQRV